MARIAGVELPRDKKTGVALTKIYGIGHSSARYIIEKAGIPEETIVKSLTDEQLAQIRRVVEDEYKIEGALRGEVTINIKRLMDIGSYRGLRHRRGLPTRGQRTSTNARTCKGPKRTVSRSRKK